MFAACLPRLSRLILACGFFVPIQAAWAQRPSIDPDRALEYFKQAEELSERDGGRLWRMRLYGPMLFVDRGTRAIVANQADKEGRLRRSGEVFVGSLPLDRNMANTATEWAGVRWTMLIWPVPSDPQRRARLMMHELFHRVQDDLGLPLSNPENNHLDTRDGRTWLRLEWRALGRALSAAGRERIAAVEDALVFRALRRARFSDAAQQERALEFNEGLAEYTGVVLSGLSASHAAAALKEHENRDTFVRSFAYASGPAYGILLDASDADWRRRLKPGDDLGGLLQAALKIKPPEISRAAAERRAKPYGGAEVIAAETKRDEDRQRRMDEYRKRFVESPILIVPLSSKVRYSFNPNGVEGFEDVGSVYRTLRVTDRWGILEVSKPALMIRRDGKVAQVRVPAPADASARAPTGDGWTLQLSEGWELTREGKRDYTITERR